MNRYGTYIFSFVDALIFNEGAEPYVSNPIIFDLLYYLKILL